MRIKPIAISAAVALLAILAWYVTSDYTANVSPPLKPEVKPVVVTQPDPTPNSITAQPPIAKVEPPLPVIELPSNEPIAWESKIDEVLRSKADHSVMARTILQQVPSMPPEGQHAAAQHITNLLSNDHYLDVLPYIQNPRLSNAFQETIVAESLNRPNNVKLPVLLAAAKLPNHPMRETSLTILTVLLGDNYGTDWQKWQAEIDKTLSKPPE